MNHNSVSVTWINFHLLEIYFSGIIHCVFFSCGLLSLCQSILRFIQVVPFINNSFFLIMSSMPFLKIYYSCCIHSHLKYHCFLLFKFLSFKNLCLFLLSVEYIIFIEIYFLYNIVLVSTVECYSVMNTLGFFSLIGC